MNKKLLLAVLLSVFLLKAFAQQDPTNYKRADIIPPSPTAANLSRYGNVPVTMYTGMANVGIPIFTVQGRDISLPISLSYNFNGLKPNEQVSWIGLGWSLQAGGVITRTIHGKIDENNTSSIYSWENSAAKYTNVNVNSDSVYLRDIMETYNYDPEPDVFSFNFAGHSGKFVIAKGKFVVFPAQKLKISGSVATFTITTEDGTIYTFGEKEVTTMKSDPTTANLGTYTSSWYLTSVKNAAQTETITLTYTDEGTVVQNGGWSQTYIKPLAFGTFGSLSAMQQTMPTFVNSKRLSSIVSAKHTVQFNAGAIRDDVAQPSGVTKAVSMLGSIDIVANGGGSIKSFHLNHSYFNPSAIYGINKYLKLSSVSEVGGTDSLTHYFSYEDEGGLPERFTYNVGLDHYGYYSGGASFGLIPNTIYSGGSNREPNLAGAKLGALKKVIYPTGGSTEFEYENNAMNTTGNVVQMFGVSKGIVRADSTTVNELTDTVSFHSNVSQMLKLNWARQAKAPYGDDNAKDNFHAEVKIYHDDEDVITNIFTGKIMSTSQNGGHLDSVAIGTGRYVIEVTCDKSENRVDVWANVGFETDIPNSNAGPGIRIKKITSNPTIGPAIIKNYKYEFGVGLLPNYSSQTYMERVHPLSNPWEYHDYHYTSYNSTLAQSETAGVPYYYGKVTEDTGSDTVTVSRSVYNFTNFEVAGNSLGVEPASEYHYKKVGGTYSLVSTKLFEYSPVYTDTMFVGIKPYMHAREYLEGSITSSKYYYATTYILASEWKYLLSTTETIYNNDTLATKTRNEYNLATRNLSAVRQTASDGTATTQKMKYPEDYTSTIAGNLVSANVVAPVIEKQVWQKRSATDSILVGGTITRYDSLMYKPVKIYALETTAGLTSLSSETKTGGKYNTLLSDNNYKQKVTYYYDSNANMNAQQLTNGITVAYQYSYPAASGLDAGENNYPVAECKNATVAEFFTENFENSGSGTAGVAHTGNKYYNGSSYTVSWTRPNSRAYVISYWYKSGGTWKYSGEVAYTGSSYTLSTGTAYDDIRIYPADAQMSTYTYFPGIGVSSTIDAKGITSYYEYDPQNRLLAIKDQYGNILKYNNYNYAH